MLFQAVLILFSFISSYVISFLPILSVPKRKKCAYKGGKLGKKSYLSLGKTGRKNRIEVEIFIFKGKREITWDWNNWNFCSLLTHTHPPHPLFFLVPLTCTFWQARRCLFCCWWLLLHRMESPETMLPRDVLWRDKTSTKPGLCCHPFPCTQSFCCGNAAVLLTSCSWCFIYWGRHFLIQLGKCFPAHARELWRRGN